MPEILPSYDAWKLASPDDGREDDPEEEGEALRRYTITFARCVKVWDTATIEVDARSKDDAENQGLTYLDEHDHDSIVALDTFENGEDFDTSDAWAVDEVELSEEK